MSGIPRTSKIEKKRHDYVVTVSFSAPVTEHEGKFMLQEALNRFDIRENLVHYGHKNCYINTFHAKSLHQVMKYLNRIKNAL